MLDIKFIRENKDLIALGAKKKLIDFDVDKLLEADDKRRELVQKIDDKNRERKAAADARDIETGKRIKDELEALESEQKLVMHDWQAMMLQVPNVPDVSVPDGESDADNKEVKKWGEPKAFDFEPKSHVDIMTALDMVDFERGTKVSGFRGYFLKNDAALLSFAIWQYALQFFLGKGFTPMIVPSLVKRESLLGTGMIPQGEEDLYKTQDGEYLAGTAEVATMGYYMNEILDKGNLPYKFLSFSPCFRREAGSHSKDVKGLIRVHEFFKLEQVVLCEASHEESVKRHEELNRNTEEFIESLGIPYHTVVNCGGDLGLGQVKKYDIELWVPMENTYREISSASYFHD
ncbi:MAG: serS, partial [Parcubacteria group bacterium]|nr:serS [Parcubacteria group bacterium]